LEFRRVLFRSRKVTTFIKSVSCSPFLFLNVLFTATVKFATATWFSIKFGSLVNLPTKVTLFIIIHHPYLIVLVLHLVLHVLVLFLFAILYSCPICLTIALFCLMLRHGLFLERY